MNERTDEGGAQYFSLYSWLFSTIVGRGETRRDGGGEGREIDRGREIGRTCSAVCALIGSLKLDDAWVMGVVQSALLFSTSCSTPRIQRVLSSHPFVPAGSPFVH